MAICKRQLHLPAPLNTQHLTRGKTNHFINREERLQCRMGRTLETSGYIENKVIICLQLTRCYPISCRTACPMSFSHLFQPAWLRSPFISSSTLSACLWRLRDSRAFCCTFRNTKLNIGAWSENRDLICSCSSISLFLLVSIWRFQEHLS